MMEYLNTMTKQPRQLPKTINTSCFNSISYYVKVIAYIEELKLKTGLNCHRSQSKLIFCMNVHVLNFVLLPNKEMSG